MGRAVNPLASAFGGSNPPLPTFCLCAGIFEQSVVTCVDHVMVDYAGVAQLEEP